MKNKTDLKEITRIGIVAMHNLSVGSGFSKVFRDLVNALNILKKEVYVLSPFEININQIEDFYGSCKIDKIIKVPKYKNFFCKDDTLARIIIKKEFRQLAKEVDLIIDIDGRILYNSLPKSFDKSKYLAWRVSPAKSDFKKFGDLPMSLKRKIKIFLKKIINIKKRLPSNEFKTYALDMYTAKELKDHWGINASEKYLYPEINTDKYYYNKKNKKNQIVVLGRIAINKRIDECIKIFAMGTKNYPEYNLVIIGGTTSDSEKYINELNKLTENLGISKRVSIIKNPALDELKKFLIDSKIFIYAQRGDSTTITAIEALASGAIVLSTKNDCGTWWELLESGKWGFGFDNIEDGSKKLNEIINKLNNNKLSPKKFIKRPEFYSHNNFIIRLKNILNEVIQKDSYNNLKNEKT